MNPLMLALDILHIMDHGVAQHVFAGTLHSLVYRQLKQRPYRNMQVLWGRMQELYKEANVAEKLSKFSLKMFCDPDSPHADFPKLSNAIKYFIYFLNRTFLTTLESMFPVGPRMSFLIFMFFCIS